MKWLQNLGSSVEAACLFLAVPQSLWWAGEAVSVLDCETLQGREPQLQQPEDKLTEPERMKNRGQLPFYTNTLSTVEM